jgi:hypothetical protein
MTERSDEEFWDGAPEVSVRALGPIEMAMQFVPNAANDPTARTFESYRKYLRADPTHCVEHGELIAALLTVASAIGEPK